MIPSEDPDQPGSGRVLGKQWPAGGVLGIDEEEPTGRSGGVCVCVPLSALVRTSRFN